jgi:hypothetical protein
MESIRAGQVSPDCLNTRGCRPDIPPDFCVDLSFDPLPLFLRLSLHVGIVAGRVFRGICDPIGFVESGSETSQVDVVVRLRELARVTKCLAVRSDRVIDTTFDFRADAGGKDPDSYSATLQGYHRLLWSKPLPGGATFELTLESHGHARVLRHSSKLGVFVLSSDTLANSSKGPCRSFYDEMGPEANGTFHGVGGTIGGRLIFPKSQIEGLQSINQARGTHPRIRDRFDLTLECIRRLYQDELSPLSATLGRYGSYFGLFRDFRGYVDFFLLNDLVEPDCSSVKFYLPFESFTQPALPTTLETYKSFRERQMEFVRARNFRIARSVERSKAGGSHVNE